MFRVQPCIYQDTVSMKPMWTNIYIICTALLCRFFFFMTAQTVWIMGLWGAFQKSLLSPFPNLLILSLMKISLMKETQCNVWTDVLFADVMCNACGICNIKIFTWVTQIWITKSVGHNLLCTAQNRMRKKARLMSVVLVILATRIVYF